MSLTQADPDGTPAPTEGEPITEAGGVRALVRERRTDPVDRDRVDRRVHVRLSGDREPRARQGRLQPHLDLLGDHVRDPVGDLPADRAAALPDDRRPPRARDARARAAHAGVAPDLVRADLPGGRAGAARPDPEQPVRWLRGALLDPRDRRARLCRQLLRPGLARRQQALRAVRRARVPRVNQPLPVRVGRRDRDRLRRRRRRTRDGGRAVRLALRDPVRVHARAADRPERDRGGGRGQRGARPTPGWRRRPRTCRSSAAAASRSRSS